MVYLFWLGAQKLLQEPTQIINKLENMASEKRAEKAVMINWEKKNKPEGRNKCVFK